MRRLFALVVVGLAGLGCGVRATVLGAQAMSRSDAGADAGVLRAPSVGTLASDACRKAFAPRLPVTCFGGSGPAPAQCVMAVWPDGGSGLVASLPSSGNRFFRRVHGVRAGLVVTEVADVTEALPVLLDGVGLDGGANVRLLTGSPRTTIPALTLRDDGFDAVTCEGTDCTLRAGTYDGATTALAANVRAPTPATALARSDVGAFAWASDAGVVLSPSTLVTSSPGGLVGFDEGDTLFVTGDAALLRVPPSRVPVTLSSDLDAPRGLFVISGHVLVVEARRVRAFPKQGGAPLVLYELSAEPGELTAPRLVDGRLVFDQVCEQLAPGVTTAGNVEVDFTRGTSRWLNEDPAFPFMRGARPAARGYRDVTATPEVVVGLVD
jgi:hypothetical protein